MGTRRTLVQLEQDMQLFKFIDNELSAYLLGYLYADGAIYQRFVRLVLHERDKIVVELLAKELNMANSVKYRNNLAILGISSKILSGRLKELGCVEKKSLVLTFPNINQVPLDMHNHFIRGYFDGDVCACIYKNITLLCNIVGTISFLTSLQEIFQNKNIKSYIYSPKSHKVSTLRISTTDNMRFFDYIYKDATYFLQRKYDKFIQRQEYLALKSKDKSTI